MLTHHQIWGAIDSLAESLRLTPSGLARRAGLDPTTFNKSKRTTSDGKERWPSTESLAKILKATDLTLDDFLGHLAPNGTGNETYLQPIPLIGFAQAGAGGFFDDGGIPTGNGWDQVRFPGLADEKSYALEVSGNSMEPLYRDGDILIVSPNSEIRKGDRVIIKKTDGQVLAKVLERQTSNWINLTSINQNDETQKIPLSEIVWTARIIWASQ